jgi:uncharacterized protein with HEPN domain
MSKDRASIHDIIQAVENIMQAMNRVSFEEFAMNREKQAAILYFLLTIGEAAKRLSPEFRDAHPQISWKEMAGMRDILAHQYDRVNVQVVWDAVQTDLPDLLIQLKALPEETL